MVISLAILAAGCSSSPPANQSGTRASSQHSATTTTLAPTTTTTTMPSLSVGATITGSSTGGDKYSATISFGPALVLDQVSAINGSDPCSSLADANPQTTVVVPASETTTGQSAFTQQLTVTLGQLGSNYSNPNAGPLQLSVIGDLGGGISCMSSGFDVTTTATQNLSDNQSGSFKLWFVYPDVLTPNAPTVASNTTLLGTAPFVFYIGGTGSPFNSTVALTGPRVVFCNGGNFVIPTGSLPNGGSSGCASPISGQTQAAFTTSA